MRLISIWFTCAVLVLAAHAVGDEAAVPNVDPYAARKVFYEELWRSKIAAALQYVEGAVVCVDVKIAPQVSRTMVATEYGSKPVTESESSKSADEIEQMVGGGSEGKKSTSSETIYTKNLVSESQVTTEIAGLTPESVSVAVSVPRSYYANVLANRQRAGEIAGEEGERSQQLLAIEQEVSAQIEEAVTGLLPRDQGDDDRVRVTSFDVIARAIEAASRIERAAELKHPDVVTVVFDAEDARASGRFALRASSLPGSHDGFRLAAQVIGVAPNGNLQVESHRTIRIGEEEIRQDLTGEISSKAVRRNGDEVSAIEIAELRLREFRVTAGSGLK
jgi:hypothetical protein